nr:MAG TPA: hypothetical protein [Caudoviricetes sp.]
MVFNTYRGASNYQPLVFFLKTTTTRVLKKMVLTKS